MNHGLGLWSKGGKSWGKSLGNPRGIKGNSGSLSSDFMKFLPMIRSQTMKFLSMIRSRPTAVTGYGDVRPRVGSDVGSWQTQKYSPALNSVQSDLFAKVEE